MKSKRLRTITAPEPGKQASTRDPAPADDGAPEGERRRKLGVRFG